MKSSIKLFTYRGVPVSLSLWFFLIFLLLSPEYVALIFISILVHELAHAHVALNLGWFVSGIEIDLLEGRAIMDGSIPPKDDLKITLAGPISNLILVGIGWIISFLLINSGYLFDLSIKFIVINIILFLFNLIPIYPLDGGRALRSILLTKMRSRTKAFKVSTAISLVLSVGLFVWSLVTFNFFIVFISILLIALNWRDWSKLR